MERPLLTDIEDRTLAMAEDDYVHFKIARIVLGTFYGRDVSFKEISSIVGRLSSLGFLRWKIHKQGNIYFRSSATEELQHNCSALFTTTPHGKAYLAAPRRVA